MDFQEDVQEIQEVPEVKGTYVKTRVSKTISDGRKRSAVTRTNNNEMNKKKANLFDRYISGDLTRDELLLAGFIPTPEKTPPKTILEQPKKEPEKPRAKNYN